MDTPNAKGSGKRRIPEPRYLAIARIVKAWGVHGQLKLQVLTDLPDRLDRLKRVYVGPRAAPHDVVRFRRQRNGWFLQLADVPDLDAAKALQGQLVQIAREDAAPLEPGQFYEHQIVGLSVVTADGEPLGQVAEVLATGANDVYVVHGPRGEVLLPARVEVVRQIDLEAGTMTVTLPPGLLPGDA